MAIAIGLLKILLELGRSRKTGALDAESGGTRVRLFVEDGDIVHAEEGGVAETLGRLLVREKLITQEQYDKALERMATVRAQGTHVKLGEVLVSLGMLTKDQVDDALATQVRRKAVRALGWSHAHVRFVECHGGELELARRSPMSTPPIVLAALAAAGRAEVEQLFSQSMDRYVALRADRVPGGGAARQEALAIVSAFEMEDSEASFADGLDGSRTVRELLADGDDAHAAVLAALLLLDCLDLHATKQVAGAAAMLRTRAPGRDPKTPARAPKLRKRAAHAGDDGHARGPAERAGEVDPSPPPSPRAVGRGSTPDLPMARVLAEQSFQNGKRLLRANDMAQAAGELKRAAALFDASEYQLWAAYAVMRCDPKGEKAHYAELQRLAEKSLAEDPELGFAYFVLGHLALRSGEESRALVMFDRARALDKEAVVGARAARLPEAEPESSIAKSDGEPEISIAKSTPELHVAEDVDAKRPPAAAPAPPPSAPQVTAEREQAPAPARPRVFSEQPAARPRRRTWVSAVVAVAALGGVAAAVRAGSREGSRAPERTFANAFASASTVSAVDAAAAEPASRPHLAPDASDESPAEIELDTAADAGARSTDSGTMDFPDAAAGHRVFMDGKVLGEPVPTVVTCGAHVVRIGGKGRDQRVVVPCDGHVLVPYP